jgi:cytoskeletal protein RodZ
LLIEIIIVLIDVYLGITSGKDPRQKYTDTIADTIVIRTDIEEDVEAMRYVPPQTTTPTPSSGASTSEPTKVTSNNLTPESSAPEPTSETTKTTTIQQEPEGTIDKAVDVGSVAEDIAKVSAAENETMNRFMELFEITEERAQALYKAGYKKLDDFKDAIVEDLVMVDQINPTIARRIIDKISNEKL